MSAQEPMTLKEAGLNLIETIEDYRSLTPEHIKIRRGIARRQIVRNRLPSESLWFRLTKKLVSRIKFSE